MRQQPAPEPDYGVEHTLKGRYLLKAKHGDLQRWKKQAKRDGLSFAEWLRTLADRQVLNPVPLAGGGAQVSGTDGKPAPRPAPSSASGSGALESAPDYAQIREKARELAQKQGRCTADVSRGTRCRLCGKIH